MVLFMGACSKWVSLFLFTDKVDCLFSSLRGATGSRSSSKIFLLTLCISVEERDLFRFFFFGFE